MVEVMINFEEEHWKMRQELVNDVYRQYVYKREYHVHDLAVGYAHQHSQSDALIRVISGWSLPEAVWT